jgi:hypothetical protein
MNTLKESHSDLLPQLLHDIAASSIGNHSGQPQPAELGPKRERAPEQNATRTNGGQPAILREAPQRASRKTRNKPQNRATQRKQNNKTRFRFWCCEIRFLTRNVFKFFG